MGCLLYICMTTENPYWLLVSLRHSCDIGINAVAYFQVHIFKKAGFSPETSLLLAGCNGKSTNSCLERPYDNEKPLLNSNSLFPFFNFCQNERTSMVQHTNL